MNIDELFRKKLSDAKSSVSENLTKKFDNAINAQPVPKVDKSLFKSLSGTSKIILAVSATAVVATATIITINSFDNNTSSIAKQDSVVAVVENKQETTQNEDTANVFNDIVQQNEVLANYNEEIKNYSFVSANQNEDSIAMKASSAAPVQEKTIVKTENTPVIAENTETKQANEPVIPKTAEPERTINSTNQHYESPKISIQIPNFISPNGDGINDCFAIKHIENYPDNMLIVKDRQGRLIFSQRNYNNEFCAENVQDGVYNYVLQVRIDNQTKAFYGNITIMRK